MSKCRWDEVHRHEQCSRHRVEGYDFCREHVEALVDTGRNLHDYFKKAPEGSLPRRVADRFLTAVVGAAGVALVEHWSSVFTWLDHLIRHEFFSVGRTPLPRAPSEIRQALNQNWPGQSKFDTSAPEELVGTDEQWRHLGHEVWSRVGTLIGEEEIAEYREILEAKGLWKGSVQ